MTITSNEADRLMNFAAYIFLRNSDSWDTDEATEFARAMFKGFAAIEGITDVDETDKKEDMDEEENGCCGNCEECDDWDWCQDIDDDCDGNCDECDEQCFVDEPDDLEIGFNPYMGGYDYDC